MKLSGLGRIGVLAGGPSSEREISLRSGRAVYNSLQAEGADVAFLDVRQDICDVIRAAKIDVAFIALHGSFGEDGTVQKILEGMNIPYTGSGPGPSRLALDKIAAKDAFSKCGIRTPGHIVLERDNFKSEDLGFIGLPVVVKPQFEGSSIGLSVVREMDSLESAVEKAFRYSARVIVEDYIDGRELTVGILEDRPLPVIEIVTKNKVYDYMAKYSDPETKYVVPAFIERQSFDKAQELGRRSHQALGCRCFSRVDMMMDRSGDIFVLEVNTIPGMTERSLLPKAAGAAGLTFNRLCVKLIEDAYETAKKI